MAGSKKDDLFLKFTTKFPSLSKKCITKSLDSSLKTELQKEIKSFVSKQLSHKKKS